jgi:ABC-2 type transport system permease protein
MMKLLSNLMQNPLIARSLRLQRLNRRRMMIGLVGTMLISHCPACMVISLVVLIAPDRFFNNLDMIGSIIFYITAIGLLVATIFLAPRSSIGAIAQEREHQTLDLLLITLLPVRSIIIGKLVSALIYALLLIASIVPLFVLCLMIGGVAIVEMMVTLLLLFTTLVAFTVIGLFVSSLARTTTNAALLTYGVALPGFLVGPFLGILPMTIALNLAGVSYQVERVVNFYGWSLAASLNPISAAVYSVYLRSNGNGFILAQETILSETRYLLYPWVIYVIFYAFVAWLLVEFTARRLERMGS